MLETQDLILDKAQFSDWKAIWNNLWRHAESAKYMLWEPTRTAEEAQDRMRRTIAYQAEHEYAVFIYEKASGQAIGFAGMREIEPGVWEETGIALGPDYVGRGYGKQVLTALMDEARARGGTMFRYACRQQNLASQGLRRACGFVFERSETVVDERSGEPYVLEYFTRAL